MANDRLYQEPVEAVVSPTSGKARDYQEPVEAVVAPTSGKAREYQAVVEVIHTAYSTAHLSATSAEVIGRADAPAAHVSASSAEVIAQSATQTAHFSASSIEVIVTRSRVTEAFTADAYISDHFDRSGSFTADAIVGKTVSVGLTSDASIVVRQTGSFTANAVIGHQTTEQIAAAAIVHRTIQGSASAAAIFSTSFTSSVSADALVVKVTPRLASFTSDAYISVMWGPWSETWSNGVTFTGSFPADAVFRAPGSGQFVAQAVIGTSRAGSISANAIALRGQAGSFTAGAFIVRRITGSFASDAIVRKVQQPSFTANASITGTYTRVYGDFSADAIRKRTMGQQVQLVFPGYSSSTAGFTNGGNSNILAGPIDVGAGNQISIYISQAFSGSGSNNIGVFSRSTPVPGSGNSNHYEDDGVGTHTFTVTYRYAWVYSWDYSASKTGAGYVVSPFVPFSISAAAVRARTISKSFTAQARLRLVTTGSFSADAWIIRGGQITLDAIAQRSQTGLLIANAVARWSISDSFTASAIIPHAFFANAAIRGGQSATFTAKARIGYGVFSSFIAQATIVPALRAEAVIMATGSGSFGADADITGYARRILSFTADAHVTGPVSRSLTAAAVISQPNTGSFTASAWIGSRFTADAAIIRPIASSFTAWAWIYSPRTDPPQPNQTPLIQIMVDGQDITNDVLLPTASFTMAVNGAPGSFSMQVRDSAHNWNFVSGSEITVDVDGRRKFGGYVTLVTRGFFFPVDDTTDPDTTERYWTLSGSDYNILFNTRVIYDKSEPANVELKSWPAGTQDDTIIKYVFDHYTTLGDEGANYDGVTHVGHPNPDRVGIVGSGGLTFGDAMREINRLISAVWYFDQFKTLWFVDVDLMTNDIGLSDHPGVGQVGYRELEHNTAGTALFNDALVWGTGKGSDDLTFSRATDATSVATHGRWQYGEFTSTLYKQASVDLRASTVVNGTPQSLRGAKNDKISWTVTTYETSYSVGQVVSIESDAFGLAAATFPIRRLTLTFPTKETPMFQLVLTHEIDEPWNMYEFYFPKFSFNYRAPKIAAPKVVIPCPQGSGGGTCDESICGITDTFTRTVVDVPHSTVGENDGGWGTSDSGIPWHLHIHESPGSSAYVDGSTGVIHGVPSGSYYNVASIGHWMDCSFPNGDWDLTFDFTWEVIGDSDGYNEAIVWLDFFSSTGMDGNSWIGELDLMSVNPANLNEGQGTIWFWGYEDEFTWTTVWSPNTQYSVRVHYDSASTTLMARVWPTADAEPGIWHATLINDDMDGNHIPVVVNSIEIGNHSSWMTENHDTWFDNISLPNVNRCTGSRFDNFNRTVANGWGTSDTGYVWSDNSGYGYAVPSVDGSSGVFTHIDLERDAYLVSSGMPSMSIFTFTAEFSISALGPNDTGSGVLNTDSLLFLFRNSDYFEVAEVSLFWWYALPGYGYPPNPGTGMYQIGGSYYDPILVSITPGVRYAIKAYIDATSKIRKIKVWQSGATEPDWQVSDNEVAEFYSGPIVNVDVSSDQIVAYNGGGPGSHGFAQTKLIDYIDFDYSGKPCYTDCSPRCGITDTFTRTVTEEGNWPTLGTSDAGIAWLNTGLSGQGTQSQSVSGGRAVIVASSPGNFYSQQATLPYTPSYPIDITVDLQANHALDPGTPNAGGSMEYIYFYAGGWCYVELGRDETSSNQPYVYAQNGASEWTAHVGVDYTSPFKAHFYQAAEGSPFEIRVWQSGAMPTATISATQATSSTPGFVIGVAQQALSDPPAEEPLTVWMDNLDVTGVAQCDGGTFDSFNRTVDGSWGRSDSGYVWGYYSTGGNPTYGVNGSAAYVTGGALYASVTDFAPVAGDFTMTSRFRWDYIPLNPEPDAMLEFEVHGPIQGANVNLDFVQEGQYVHSYFAYYVWDQDGAVELYNETFFLGSVTTDWYLIKWDSKLGIKVWPEGSAEPDWQLVYDISGQTRTTFRVRSQAGVDGTTNYIDYIDFDYAGKCAEAYPAAATVDCGGMSSSVATGGQKTFTLPEPFIPDSSRVWVNGYFQRPGYEYVEHAAAGTIVFTDALNGGELVHIEYVADWSS